MLAVDDGLDDMPGDRLGNEEQGGHRQRHGPTRIDGSSERYGKEGGDQTADEGHEAHQTGEDAPQDCIRHADEPQARRDEQAETGVEQHLHEEEAAEARSRIVERRRRSLQISRPRKPQEAIADVFPLQQDEDEKQHHQRRHGERRQQRPHQRDDRL